MAISTHKDLSRILLDIAKHLEKVPPLYLVSDGSTLNNLRAAARILIEQDEKIGDLTVQVRTLKYGK